MGFVYSCSCLQWEGFWLRFLMSQRNEFCLFMSWGDIHYQLFITRPTVGHWYFMIAWLWLWRSLQNIFLPHWHFIHVWQYFCQSRTRVARYHLSTCSAKQCCCGPGLKGIESQCNHWHRTLNIVDDDHLYLGASHASLSPYFYYTNKGLL